MELIRVDRVGGSDGMVGELIAFDGPSTSNLQPSNSTLSYTTKLSLVMTRITCINMLFLFVPCWKTEIQIHQMKVSIILHKIYLLVHNHPHPMQSRLIDLKPNSSCSFNLPWCHLRPWMKLD